MDVLQMTIQSVLDEKAEADRAAGVLRDNWNQKRLAFLQDCDRIDKAISDERENLRGEIGELTDTIKRLSGQLAAGVASSGRLDRDTKETLRKLIGEARSRKDEAQATLDGLADVKPEYSRELYDAAVSAKADFLSFLRGEYANRVAPLRDVLTEIEKAARAADSVVGNRVNPHIIDKESADIEKRFGLSDGQELPGPLPTESVSVRSLGEPLKRPEYWS